MRHTTLICINTPGYECSWVHRFVNRDESSYCLQEAVLHEVVPPVLVTACPNLRELSLVDCHYVTYGTPAYNDMVCQMPTPTAEQYAAWSLREICFDGDHITEDEEPVSDRSIPRIQKQFQQQAQRLLSLTEVSFEDGSHDFWKCVGVPFVRGAAQFLQRVHLHDDVLQDVLMDVHYPALEYLYTATSPLTDTILTAVIEQCPALLHLHVGRLQLKTCHNLGVCVPWKTLSMCGNELQIDQMGMLPFLENSSISSLLDTEYDRVTVQFPRAGAQGSYPTEHDAVQAFKQGIQMIQRLPKSCLDQLAECTWVVVESGQLSPATTLMLLQAVQCIFTSLQYVWFDQLTGLNAAHFQYVSASNCSEVRFTACTFEDGALPQLLEIAPQIHTVEFFKVPEEAILALVLTASRKICVKVYKYWMTDLKWRQRVEKALRFAGKSHLVTIEEI